MKIIKNEVTEKNNNDDENEEKISHDYDAAWKMILEAFTKEVVEILFPDVYPKIDWNKDFISLDNELEEIQKSIFIKEETEKIISDKIIRVYMKDKTSRLLFIHVEVQSYNKKNSPFSERMFRYFYRIWDKFRYKGDTQNDIIAAAIYTYNGKAGKDKEFVYKIPEAKEEIIHYNFRILDVQKYKIENISENNPLRVIFEIAKKLLSTSKNERDILNAKVELAQKLKNYMNIDNTEQIKAMQYFLEYLFLIKDEGLKKEYEKIIADKDVKKMTVQEIYEKNSLIKGRNEGINIGRSEGIDIGRSEGINIGRSEGIIKTGLLLKLPKEKIIELLKEQLDIDIKTAEKYFEEFNK